jgi:anti-sigma regulatory factor (Ser/Thr protein kinase)
MIWTLLVGSLVAPDGGGIVASVPSSLFQMRATLEQLPQLERWVSALPSQFTLRSGLLPRIDLCLAEIVTNLICHGYPDGEAGMVEIRLSRHADRVEICIEDDGRAFDPTAYVPPALPGSIAEAPIGGRGIRLVRHFADELRHRRDAGHNQLTLVFRD